MHQQTRARDSDRSASTELIEAAFADGQLTQDEYDLRVERALRAQTLGELDALTRDLQGERPAVVRAPRPAPQLRVPALLRPRVWWLALVPVLVGIIIAVAAIRTVSGGELFEAEALEELVADAREDLGSTRVDDIIVFETHAVLTRAQAGSPNRAERLTYRTSGGFDHFTKTTRDTATPIVDLADVDWAAAVALLERAPELVGVSDSTPEDWHMSVRSADGGHLYIYVSNEYSESGSVIANLDGEVRDVQPFEPR